MFRPYRTHPCQNRKVLRVLCEQVLLQRSADGNDGSESNELVAARYELVARRGVDVQVIELVRLVMYDRNPVHTDPILVYECDLVAEPARTSRSSSWRKSFVLLHFDIAHLSPMPLRMMEMAEVLTAKASAAASIYFCSMALPDSAGGPWNSRCSYLLTLGLCGWRLAQVSRLSRATVKQLLVAVVQKLSGDIIDAPPS